MAAKKKAETTKKAKEPDKITLVEAPLFHSPTSQLPVDCLTGDFYLYDGIRVNGRTRICRDVKDRGRVPASAYYIGWVVA